MTEEEQAEAMARKEVGAATRRRMEAAELMARVRREASAKRAEYDPANPWGGAYVPPNDVRRG
jgi:hypothetical protein